MARPLLGKNKKVTLSLTFSQQGKEHLKELSKYYGTSQSELLEELAEKEYKKLQKKLRQ